MYGNVVLIDFYGAHGSSASHQQLLIFAKTEIGSFVGMRGDGMKFMWDNAIEMGLLDTDVY